MVLSEVVMDSLKKLIVANSLNDAVSLSTSNLSLEDSKQRHTSKFQVGFMRIILISAIIIPLVLIFYRFKFRRSTRA